MSQNRDIYQILNDIYKAYIEKDCERFFSLLKEAESIDSSNVYLVKYKNLYKQICWDESWTKNKKVTWRLIKYMWKTIKCPHCWAPLVEDEYNKKVIQDYKSWKITKLKFKCPYCWTKFVWDFKWVRPLFLKDIRVGWEYEVNWEKYKVAWVVQYSWIWEEDWDKWELVYNEYILYNKNGDIFRLSESESKWRTWTYYETEREVELSKKVEFPYKIDEITEEYIKIEGKTIYFEEKDKVTVKKVYWEVWKWYEIWEKVILYEFSYNWKNYVLEKEESKSNKEANFYEVVYRRNYHNYENNISTLKDLSLKKTFSYLWVKDILVISGLILFMIVVIFIPETLIIFVFFWYLLIEYKDSFLRFSTIFLYLFILSVFSLLWYNMLYKKIIVEKNILELSKDRNLEVLNQLRLSKLSNLSTWLYELYFKWNKPYTYKYISTYDAWWKEYKYTYYNWFYFKIENDDDRQVLVNFLKDFIKNKDMVLPLDKKANIKVNLKDYNWNLQLRKVKYKNILWF